MCTTCGCGGLKSISDVNGRSIELPHHDHDHGHDGHMHDGHTHDHGHEHAHGHSHDHHDHGHDHAHRVHGATHSHTHEDSAAKVKSRTVLLEQEILAKNGRLAERNRGWLAARRVLALNLVSSPGSGKTTFLERTLRDLRGKLGISVIEGDQETANDADRIRAAGARAVQINTGTGCHLDAEAVGLALEQLDPQAGTVAMIENVGNLVCPALFDLGERAKVAILSVTEGEDKPLKYPHMFRASQLIVLNKVDLLPYVQFDMQRCLGYVHDVNPTARVLQVSATRGDGMSDWYSWLNEHVKMQVRPS